MTYELVDMALRKANEYRNTSTRKFELLRFCGAYRIQESFLMPDGDVLVLAFDEGAALQYLVGVYGRPRGVYRENAREARQYFAWLIAESFGLVVDKEGSKAVVPASRDYATDLAEEIKRRSMAWLQATRDQDESAQEQAAAELEEHASSLAKHLQRTGVLTRKVYESWEAVG
ncbi:hypothetical protein [Streptomyces sp. NPDC055036]